MTTGFYGTQHRSIQTNVEHIITRSVNIQKGRMFGQTWRYSHEVSANTRWPGGNSRITHSLSEVDTLQRWQRHREWFPVLQGEGQGQGQGQGQYYNQR